MILYEHPLSPYAQKNKIALLEKGIEHELRLPAGIGSGAPGDGEFEAGSPRREVPLLVDGDVVVFDSSIILEYLEDAYPEPPLRPSGAADRARVRMLEEVVDHHYEPITWGLAEIRYFKRAEGELAERLQTKAREQIGRLHAWLEHELGEREWLNGATFGWGDLAVAPFLNGAVGFDLGPEPGSKLGAWLARVNQRETVARVREQAASAITAMSAVEGLVASGRFKRQYRDHRLEWMIKSGGVEVVLRGLERDNIRFNEVG